MSLRESYKLGHIVYRWYVCPRCGKHLLRDPALVRGPRFTFCSRTGQYVRLRLLPEGNSNQWTHSVSPKKGRRKTVLKRK